MKTGRNAPCPCGSGKKYKKCCLDKDQQAGQDSSNKNGFVQPPSQEADRKIYQKDSGINVRPYVMAKICDPAERGVQDLSVRRPELAGMKRISVSKFRSLTKEQILKQLSENGISYNQDQFIVACEKKNSAWDVAEMLWPKQVKSYKKNVSDTVCLSTSVLWERLYEERKLTRISVEMLDDWMEDGYKQLNEDRLKACRTWKRVWEAFKKDYDLANRSIDEIDTQFNGSQSFFEWCQVFEMELINASIDSKEYAEIGVSYMNEFLNYFADEDSCFLSQFKSSLGECYCRSGDQEAGEKVMREIIDQYPEKSIGYIGLEMAFSIREKNGQVSAKEERLKILEEAKNYPVIDGSDYDLDSRISDLREEISKKA